MSSSDLNNVFNLCQKNRNNVGLLLNYFQCLMEINLPSLTSKKKSPSLIKKKDFFLFVKIVFMLKHFCSRACVHFHLK